MPTVDIEKGEGVLLLREQEQGCPPLANSGMGEASNKWGPAVDHATHSCLEQKPQGAASMQQVGEARHIRAPRMQQCQVGKQGEGGLQ